MLGVGVALLVSGNWMLGTMVSFTTELFAQLPQMLGG
jgi:flagellar biosynthetic protein FliQ